MARWVAQQWGARSAVFGRDANAPLSGSGLRDGDVLVFHDVGHDIDHAADGLGDENKDGTPPPPSLPPPSAAQPVKTDKVCGDTEAASVLRKAEAEAAAAARPVCAEFREVSHDEASNSGTNVVDAPPLEELEAVELARAVLQANLGGWADEGVAVADIHVATSDETEWHAVYFLSTPRKRKMVVHFPSWRGAVRANKAAASRHADATGLGPRLLGDVVVPRGGGGGQHSLVGTASEWLGGGQLSSDDVEDKGVMARLGSLYGRLHCADSAWFDSSVPALSAEGKLPSAPVGGAGGTTAAAAAWASCLFVLPWLLEQVPASNKAALAAQGVDWGFVAAEINGLPSNPLLPSTPTVTVHGDSHSGNIMKDDTGELHLIDFDMTARGPAGSEWGFITLMIFRCGFAPELVLPRDTQRAFARGYLAATAATPGPANRPPCDLEEDHKQEHEPQQHEREDALLAAMHAWTYVGLLKMGLLCAVLMDNGGHAKKREVMRKRGPVLLHRGFLLAAQGVLRQAAVAGSPAQEELIDKGLFFVAEDAWQRGQKEKL